jgi:hypothetical protein
MLCLRQNVLQFRASSGEHWTKHSSAQRLGQVALQGLIWSLVLSQLDTWFLFPGRIIFVLGGVLGGGPAEPFTPAASTAAAKAHNATKAATSTTRCCRAILARQG